MRSKKPREFNEEEFFGFAKSYLSEAFPNPQRLDCPPDCELIRLAEQSRDADPDVTQHLARCSSCFVRYTVLITDLKRRKAG
jgi:hypothetical protein